MTTRLLLVSTPLPNVCSFTHVYYYNILVIFFPQMGVAMVRVVGQQCMVEQEVLGEAVKRNDSSYVVFER